MRTGQQVPTLYLGAALLFVLLTAGCSEASDPLSAVTQDLGDGYTQVTSYDKQGREKRIDTYYSGEMVPSGYYEVGKAPQPEMVQDYLVGYSLFSYDTEG